MPTMPLTVFQHAATALSRRKLSRLYLYQHCLLACTRKTLVISRFLRCLKCQDISTPVLLITVWTYLHHVNHVSWVHLRRKHKMILKWCLSLTKQEVSSGSNRWKPSSVATLSSTWTAGNSPTHPDNWNSLECIPLRWGTVGSPFDFFLVNGLMRAHGKPRLSPAKSSIPNQESKISKANHSGTIRTQTYNLVLGQTGTAVDHDPTWSARFELEAARGPDVESTWNNQM